MKNPKRIKEMENVQRRASMQDFRNFPLYLTGELWNLMEGTDTTVSQLRKVERLCTYLVNCLDCRLARRKLGGLEKEGTGCVGTWVLEFLENRHMFPL